MHAQFLSEILNRKENLEDMQRWEDNIKTDLTRIQNEVVDWTNLAQDVNTVNNICIAYMKNRDSSVGIALGYRLDDRGSRVRFPEGAGNFSLHHRFQNDSGAHPASYPMGTGISFRGGKAVGA
jgi:hypothetical protein